MIKGRRKLDVLGLDYTVEMDPNMNPEDSVLGKCHIEQCRIRIAAEIAPSQQRQTLCHELGHAIFSAMGLNYDFKDPEDEEKIVDRMGTGLLYVLRANPWLVQYLTEK